MPWGGAGGQNIEHPHTLVSLSSVFFCIKCVLIVFRRSTLSCDSAYIVNQLFFVLKNVQVFCYQEPFCVKRHMSRDMTKPTK